MTIQEIYNHLRKSPADAWYYVQGETRLYIYRRWPELLRQHIREQYEWRKKAANLCYSMGECQCCGCTTPNLFFANKGCSIAKKLWTHCELLGEPCYPPMMNRRDWIVFKTMQR